jgi:hypothetical protein
LLETAQPAPEDRSGFVRAELRSRRVGASAIASLRGELAEALAVAHSAVERSVLAGSPCSV